MLQEVQEKRFREDLYYRLLGLPIEIAPLRDRENDVLILAKYFIDGFCKDNKMQKKTLSEEAQQKLIQYNFPGNVRELKSIIELAIVMSDSDIVQAQHIMLSGNGNPSQLLMKEISLREYERQIIQHYLDKYNRDVLLVARKLDIGKSTIYRMIQNGELKTA